MTEYPTGGSAGDPNTPPPNQPPNAPGQQPYGAPGQQPYGAPGQPPVSPSDQRMWAMLSHIGGILFGFLAPLIIFLMYKDRDEFVKDQSTEALNFQITVAIAYVASFILMFIFIGILTFFATWILAIVFGIIGGLAANRGERYRYPINIRLVK